jgi:hypothetical protein
LAARGGFKTCDKSGNAGGYTAPPARRPGRSRSGVLLCPQGGRTRVPIFIEGLSLGTLWGGLLPRTGPSATNRKHTTT